LFWLLILRFERLSGRVQSALAGIKIPEGA